MSRRRPTESETEILSVLWDRGPSTVRQVHDLIGERRGIGYTTVLKLMQIMLDKGLVRRDAQGRSHIYRPAHPREQTQRRLVNDLVDRAFGGSASALVMRALGETKASPRQLDEIRALLDGLEGGAEGSDAS